MGDVGFEEGGWGEGKGRSSGDWKGGHCLYA